MSNTDNQDNNPEEIQEAETLSNESSHYEELAQKISELNDKLLRSAAESDNLRKRYEKQIDEVREYSITNLARDLISVKDNLERSVNYKPSNLPEDLNPFYEGVVMTLKELDTVFNKHGITAISPNIGDKFDYNHHMAISQVATSDHPKDAIVGLMQVGYKIKDRLLRPASVSVAKESS